MNLKTKPVNKKLTGFIKLRLQVSDYLSFSNAALIFTNAFSIFSILLAKDNLIQPGAPNALPVTVYTWALFNRYIQRSSAFSMISSPSDLPKKADTLGKI